MPCYQVNTIKVEFNIKHFHLIEKAAKNLGWNVKEVLNGFYVYEKDRLLFTVINSNAMVSKSYEGIVNMLKREYSKEAIRYAAQKAGWVKQQKGDKTSYVKKQF